MNKFKFKPFKDFVSTYRLVFLKYFNKGSIFILLDKLRMNRIKPFFYRLLAVRLISKYNKEYSSILLFSFERFNRFDVDALKKIPFNVYVTSGRLQTIYVNSIIKSRRNVETDLYCVNFWNDVKPYDYLRSLCREHYIRLVKYLSKTLSLKAVIGPAVWYRSDVDLGIAFQKSGIPYIVLHKENLATSPGHFERLKLNFSYLGSFGGHSVITHNNQCKSAMISSGFVTNKQVFNYGAPRFDSYYENCKSIENPTSHNVVLFSFHMATGLYGNYDRWTSSPGEGLHSFFNETHKQIGLLAHNYPSTPFTVKLKWHHLWHDQVVKAIELSGYKLQDLPNVKITSNDDPTLLIRNSSLIIAFGSTTVIEPCLLGRKVIMPYYLEAVKNEYQDYIHFKDYFEDLCIANSPDNLYSLISKVLNNPPSLLSDTQPYLNIFQKTISKFDGKCLERFVDHVKQL